MADVVQDPHATLADASATRPSVRLWLHPHWLVWLFILMMLSPSIHKWMTHQPRWVGEQQVATFVVDINTADRITLAGLPGLGPQIAQRVVEHRQTHGRFVSPEDLIQVKGIGPGKMARLRPYLIAGPHVATPAEDSSLTQRKQASPTSIILEESEPLPDAMTNLP